jgi:hypothetical protein
MSHTDGGSAFPTTEENFAHSYVGEGMSLRDYIAAKALQGLLANPSHSAFPEQYAQWAYEYADLMLKERAKQ